MTDKSPESAPVRAAGEPQKLKLRALWVKYCRLAPTHGVQEWDDLLGEIAGLAADEIEASASPSDDGARQPQDGYPSDFTALLEHHQATERENAALKARLAALSDELAPIRAMCIKAGMDERCTTLGYIQGVFYRLGKFFRESGETVDTADLNTAAERRAGSIPASRTSPIISAAASDDGARPPQGWLDIESAPKDGSEILCTWVHALRDGRQHWCGTMHVLSWFKDWHGAGRGAWVLDGDFNVHFEPDDIHQTPPIEYGDPTHWMPLPDAPTRVTG